MQRREGKPDTLTVKDHYTVDELLAIMAYLRSDRGCPWDRAQTHESVQGNLLEEAYEGVDAIQSGDPDKLCEELGDILMQVVFHAQMADEAGRFAFEDVVDGICRKLISRHSHLFGDDVATTPDAVLATWEKNKRKEKGQTTTSEALADVPRAMPALTRAFKLQKKAANVGFDWPNVDGSKAKIIEETRELFEAIDQGEATHIREEAGDLLFAVVNTLRILHVDPEAALTGCSEKFIRRFRAMEALALERGDAIEGMTLEEMDRLWDAVKAKERTQP
ncbi:MAG: nucleoside triphosphate pyrophosphohydrolase [Saccharofermentanales bacterium]|jgi:tetrapyrrole methylase family protein/MazG family protein